MNSIITQLTVTENITLITLDKIPADHLQVANIFDALGQSKLNLDMISQTPPYKGYVSISFTLPDDDLFTAIQTLKAFRVAIPSLRIDINSNNVKLSLFGEKMKVTPGTAAKTMNLLAEAGIDIKLITTSEVDISYLIYTTDQQKAIETISNYYRIEPNFF